MIILMWSGEFGRRMFVDVDMRRTTPTLDIMVIMALIIIMLMVNKNISNNKEEEDLHHQEEILMDVVVDEREEAIVIIVVVRIVVTTEEEEEEEVQIEVIVPAVMIMIISDGLLGITNETIERGGETNDLQVVVVVVVVLLTVATREEDDEGVEVGAKVEVGHITDKDATTETEEMAGRTMIDSVEKNVTTIAEDVIGVKVVTAADPIITAGVPAARRKVQEIITTEETSITSERKITALQLIL